MKMTTCCRRPQESVHHHLQGDTSFLFPDDLGARLNQKTLIVVKAKSVRLLHVLNFEQDPSTTAWTTSPKNSVIESETLPWKLDDLVVEAAVWNDLVSGVVLEISGALNVVTSVVVATLVMTHACAEQHHDEYQLAKRDLGSAQIQSLVGQNRQKSALVASQMMLGAALRNSAKGHLALLPQ